MVPELALLTSLVPIGLGYSRGKGGNALEHAKVDSMRILAATLIGVCIVLAGHIILNDPEQFLGKNEFEAGDGIRMAVAMTAVNAGLFGGAYIVGNAFRR